MQLAEFKHKYRYDQSTVVMQQYLDIKFAHPDCLLLFRLGDFYELFFEDAVIVSELLSIVLTTRGYNKSDDDKIAMCGIPYHALDNYLNRLLEGNKKIAICEQLETPEQAKQRGGYKAVVNRAVVRIITPGTIIEDALLPLSSPNYLVSIVIAQNKAAICYVDLSTSFIAVSELSVLDLSDELIRLSPSEILCSDSFKERDISKIINDSLCSNITYQVDSFFSFNKNKNIVLNFYNIADSKAIGELSALQISAIGSVLEYLTLTQKRYLPKLPLPQIVQISHFMQMDMATRRNLEITSSLNGKIKGSVFGVINQTVTAAGSRGLYRMLSAPLTKIEIINHRLDIIECFINNMALTIDIRQLLKKTSDLERCLTRITMNRSSPRDLLAIARNLKIALQIKGLLVNHYGLTLPLCLEELASPLSGDTELIELINSAIREDTPSNLNATGIINCNYHPKVAELCELISNSKTYIDKLKRQYQKDTGIETLKIQHNNMLGLFIEITSKQSHKTKDMNFIHRQTTVNSVRYTTTELQKLESDIVNANSLLLNLEQELYQQVCQYVVSKIEILRTLAASLGMLDVFCNLAYVADEYNYVRPHVTEDKEFIVTGGRHVVVEKNQVSSSFVKNDCVLSEDSHRIWLLTGPNMAGKSTFLRQNAIIAVLAQIGSFVPANNANIGIVDKLLSRIGSGDDLSRGQSTFMMEMLETSAILAQATPKSMVIFDEIGRGTATYDGVSIAWAILEHIHDNIKCRCLFATHYHELTALTDLLNGLANYTVAIEELADGILFLHHIIPGAANKSYGVHVAKLAGLPASVIGKANNILQKFENTHNKREKQILKDETNNLSFIVADNYDTNADKKYRNYTSLINEIDKINPDNLSPREALNALYNLKNIVN